MFRRLAFLLFLSKLAFASDLYLINIKSTINPGTTSLLEYGLKETVANNGQALIVKLNTPGGLLSTTRDLVSMISESKVPVIVYVGPQGASATSAGSFILIASHYAVMNKGTNVGAASPVSGDGSKMDETMASKVMNDTKAFMRSIAIERGRNEIEAENFVTHATSLTDAEALKKNIVNLIIENESDLLTSIHKKEITFQKEKFIFETEGSKIIEVKPRMIDTILTHIAHPQLSYMLMSIGSIGLIYEITHPGVILPGVAGAIALILGLIALQTLPVSTGMMSLLFLGIAMMVAEIFVPSFGALGIGGLIAFFLGSLYLFDDPTVRVPLSLVFSITGSIGSVFLFLGYLIASSRRRKKIDHFSLVGLEGNAISDFKDSGWVFVNGERWKAQSKTEIKNGDKVIVKQMISNSKIEVEKLTKGI